MTAYYSVFQMILDRAPPSPDPDCEHGWQPIVGSNYERSTVEIVMVCKACHSVRMPSFRETMLHFRIPALPQHDDSAEAIAFGEINKRLEALFPTAVQA